MIANELEPGRAHILPQQRRPPIDLLLGTTLLLCIVRLWLMPLPSSFWVDEFGTAFVVHHGASDPSLRAVPQVADSIYFILPRLAEHLGGTNEIAYRLFSVLAMGAALLALAGIAARTLGKHTAWFVVFACLAMRNFNYEAADARPYALGSFVLVFAILLLIRWLDSGRTRDGLLFALMASLLWWVHLVFWPFYILFILYTGWRIRIGQSNATRTQLLGISAAVTTALLPVAVRCISLLREASSHVVVPPPTGGDLAAELKLSTLCVACTAALLAGRYFGWKPRRYSVGSASTLLIAGWWLIDPLALYGFSWITGNSVFVPRYMFLAIPGMTLAMAVVVGTLVPAEQWKRVALALGVGVLIFGGHWGRLWPQHQNSGWKSAAMALQRWSGGTDIPVICPSPFIEARAPVWRPDYPVSGFLYSHLSVYRIGGHIYPFPFEASPEALTYARALSLQTLSHSPRFAIYGGDRSVRYWQEWFSARPEFDTWDNRILALYGDVEIVVFTPGGSGSVVSRARVNSSARNTRFANGL